MPKNVFSLKDKLSMAANRGNREPQVMAGPPATRKDWKSEPTASDFILGAALVSLAPVFGPLYALAIYGESVRYFSSLLPSSYLKEYLDGKFGA